MRLCPALNVSNVIMMRWMDDSEYRVNIIFEMFNRDLEENVRFNYIIERIVSISIK